MEYILTALLYFNGQNGANPTFQVWTQEYKTKESCEYAKDEFYKKPLTDKNPYKNAYCTPK